MIPGIKYKWQVCQYETAKDIYFIRLQCIDAQGISYNYKWTLNKQAFTQASRPDVLISHICENLKGFFAHDYKQRSTN